MSRIQLLNIFHLLQNLNADHTKLPGTRRTALSINLNKLLKAVPRPMNNLYFNVASRHLEITPCISTRPGQGTKHLFGMGGSALKNNLISVSMLSLFHFPISEYDSGICVSISRIDNMQ